jgi:DNA-binding GntR family transcriptional regulator
MTFHRTVKRALTQNIRNTIVRGLYPPGTHLRLEDLAAQFDVSTMPIREALQSLESEGIVTSIPHRGSFVTRFSADELLDIYEIRATLEQMATRAAVPNINAERFDQLQQLIDNWKKDEDVVAIVQTNTEFHTTLYEAAQRQHLCTLISQLRYRTHHYLHAYLEEVGRLDKAQEEHQAIVDACREGDTENAGELMYQHIWLVGTALADYVKKS